VLVKVWATNRKGTSDPNAGQGAVLPRKPAFNPDKPVMAKMFDGVDQITMFVIKPMVKYGILPLAKPIVCKKLLDYAFTLLKVTKLGTEE